MVAIIRECGLDIEWLPPKCNLASALSRLPIKIDWQQTPQLQGASGEDRVRGPIEVMRRRRCGVGSQPWGGGGQEAVAFVARRQCLFLSTILLASRAQPLGPPSILFCRRERALGLSPCGGNGIEG